MATLFHEIDPNKLEDALSHGLKQGDGGSKRDATINKTDTFLRKFQPEWLVRAGVDRQANIFCYLTRGQQAIDITTGSARDPVAIARDHEMTMLQVKENEHNCYVGNIDLYDQIKDLLVASKVAQARQLASVYWKYVVPLAGYSEQFRRPEVLITCDIPASNVSAT